MSKDIPIIFSAPMVRALLEGRKTQTRRIVKNVPSAPAMDNVSPNNIARHPAPYLDAYCGQRSTPENPRGQSRNWCWWTRDDRPGSQFNVKYQPGDRLWVRENFAYVGTCDPGFLTYGATYPHDLAKYGLENVPGTLKEAGYKWKPSIHMPRQASRLTLLVTGVKVERLKEISEADAVAEGISRLFTDEECRSVAGIAGSKPEDHGWQNYLWHGLIGRGITGAQSDAWSHQFSGYKDARGSFSSLWCSINGPDAWDANPFVVAITFRVIKANIDAPEALAA